jgi:MoxR-like ATPase
MEISVEPPKININIATIIELQRACKSIQIDNIKSEYISIILQFRNSGIKISDRRAIKLLNLIASSALICGRKEANLSDLWVLKHIWDTEEQIEILESIIDKILTKENSEKPHLQSNINTIPDPEVLIKDIELLNEEMKKNPDLSSINIIKDKLRHIQTRNEWIQNELKRNFIHEKIDIIWKQILAHQ